MIYRERFQPSDVLDRPHVMAAMMVICADTDEEAALLSTSGEQSFVALRAGSPGKLKPPIAGYRDGLPPEVRAGLDFARSVSATGSPASVRTQIQAFIERTQADEIIVAGAIWDPGARERSLQLTVEALE
jgi:alkanesulfonate monooxygenase SsuD/methylene tetrahydromethanopterin reductase-like flavin-dependent oxidoreductase (luciferase family)